MRRVMVMVVMSPGTADHFHAGSHFHAALRDRTAATLENDTTPEI
jgi:hypothetical protein